MTLTQHIDRWSSNGARPEWSRSAAARPLIAAALAISLLLGGAFVSIGRLHSSPSDYLDHPDHAVTDDQSKAEVVEPAKEIVTIGRLQKAAAGYMLMSCRNEHDPPYQGAIYLTFTVPADVRTDRYFQGIAAAMSAQGWHEGLEPTQRVYGKTLYKDGVTAIIYRDSDYPTLGVARLYGQCRNVSDHRTDTTAWTDISDQFGRAR
ncbi:MAG TPA: hypothetical protein VFA16_02295 [Mycobacterium sp.]|uniref:hypothetical protein n=1 Tax=Mycobacterium sp. TaxID=1785 RepID=UPI002D3FBC20|nr:hypothetical protein [Mycobacterium sp.]HZU46078.1 hypothetical protein [Mycobacterium sp.]